MTLHVFLFLLLSFLMLCQVQLCHWDWTHPQPSHSQAETIRITVNVFSSHALYLIALPVASLAPLRWL